MSKTSITALGSTDSRISHPGQLVMALTRLLI